uniref:Uncharacterized protein n=1 Tax=Arion vulgaris TaxID=1028688 RepID=A0A0B6Z607_9EUPU
MQRQKKKRQRQSQKKQTDHEGLDVIVPHVLLGPSGEAKNKKKDVIVILNGTSVNAFVPICAQNSCALRYNED